MARITGVAVQDVSVETAAIFKEIEEAFGMVPNLFKTYAHHLPLLKANWGKVKAVIMEGVLSPKVKQTIAVLVSKDNGCAYCVAAHTGALKAIGVSDGEIALLEEDVERAAFTAKEKALIAFARKANTAPLKITDAEFQVLRSAGATDGEIIESLGVMELFAAFNKFLDCLQVEIDF